MIKMQRTFQIALLGLISIAFPATSAGVEFASPVSYPVGTSPAGVVVADFNGDGKLDIAVANSGSANVSILLGNGDGTFQAAVNFDAGMANPASLAMGDFNHDGKLDLVIFHPSPNVFGGLDAASLSILLGNGDGSFQVLKTTTLGMTIDLAVGDFNLDGKADVAVTDYDQGSSSTRVLILIGNGDGTFQSAKQSAVFPLGFGYLAATDFNNDGKPDLAIGVLAGVSILLGNGDGTFQVGPAATVGDGFEVKRVQAGDINADGKLDLVVHAFSFSSSGTDGPRSRIDHISIFLGNGNGTLQGERIAASASWSKGSVFGPAIGDSIDSPVLGDYNGDGKLDLAFSRSTLSGPFRTSESLEIRLGKGDGTFSSALRFSQTRMGATGYFNGDKLSDLIFLDASNNAASIALNTSPTSGADLGISDAGADKNPAGVGMDLTYFADVLNEGPQDATGVTFTDTLPNGVNFVSVATTRGTCTQAHGVVTCNLGSVRDAEFAEVKIIVTPNSTGTIANSMNVTANESDLALANNSTTQTTTVVPVFTLTVAKAGSGSGTIQSTLRFSGAIDCGATCSATILGGNTVALVAVPSSTSVFAGWSGGCTGTDPNVCSVTMNSNQSVTAQFGPAPDFTMNPAATSLTVKRGGQVSDVLTFPAQGGFSGSIALACSVAGPAPMPTCGISPASVTPGTNATLTVSAAALSASLTAPWFEQGATLYGAWLSVGLLGCVLATGFDKKRRRLWALCLLMMAATILPAACGGSSSVTKGPPPQNYTVTVTATSGAIQHSTQVTVTVN